MRPLTLDDLLPLEEYASRRREFFETLERYLDRYRRVRVGPQVTVVFENRQTLWFRVQEVLRIARLADAARVQQELDVYNRLLPARDRLQAVLLIDVTDEARWAEEQAAWRALRGEDVQLCLGDAMLPAELLTGRPEDMYIGTAHWLRFKVSAQDREDLTNFRKSVSLVIETAAYAYTSSPLSDEIRRSLLDDLQLSDRDDAA
jgi:hypothetical protein